MRIEGVGVHDPSRPTNPAGQEFSVVVRRRETVALVGPSGAGKSTVLSMLLREAGMDQTEIDMVLAQGAVRAAPTRKPDPKEPFA